MGCSNGWHTQYLKSVPRSEREGLAILNFNNTSNVQLANEFDPWTHGIPSMLMTDLESIGLFNIVSRKRIKDILAEQKLQASGLVDPETAVQMGRLIAAHYILTGSYGVINGKMRIEAHVFSVQSGVLLGAAEVTGATSAFFELEKELVFKISNYLKAMLSKAEKLKIGRNIETRSIQASLNNYAGEMALSEAQELRSRGHSQKADGALARARENFRSALGHDPDYQRAKQNLRQLLMGVPLTL